MILQAIWLQAVLAHAGLAHVGLAHAACAAATHAATPSALALDTARAIDVAAPAATDPAPNAVQESASGDATIVHAKRLYTAPGEVLENVAITVGGGKIRAILPGVVAPRDAVEVEVVTAGLVDASARIHDGLYSVEQSTEVQPHREVAASIDPFDVRWRRLAESGVTTAYVAPLDRNVIGGIGVALKTAGPHSVEARRVEGRRFVTGAIGTSPSSSNSPAFNRPTSFYNRRPTTRMGVEWEWRKAFFDAVAAKRLPEREFEGADVLRRVLAGELGLYITAWATQDIRTAVFLVEEMEREGFGKIQLVVDAAAEAWKEPKLLQRTGASVILPPFPSQGRTNDQSFMPLEVAKTLADSGIPFALSAHDGRDPAARLDAQAGFAMRGGLTREQALAAVTTTPARILGIDSRVGSVEVGKDADLALWNGEPFEATSRVVGVLVGGAWALDPRP